MDWKNWETWQGWIIDGFKALIGIMLLWVGKWLKKNSSPYLKSVKSFFKMDVRLIELELKIKQIEETKIINTNRSFAFLRTLVIPYFITDGEGNLTFANDAWLKMTGFNDLGDALGGGYLQAIPKENRKAMMEERDDFFKHPAPYQAIVYFENIQTQNLVKTSCRSDLVYDHAGKLAEVIGRLEILSITPKTIV